MGRARISLKRISNDNTRKQTFRHRGNGLMKKIRDFCTMCGAEACLIVYGDGIVNEAGPMTWPQDPTRVRSIVEKYEHQKNEKTPKTFDIEEFFENRKNMVDAEISRVQKEIIKIKYPTWDPSFSVMGEEQLRTFIAMLDARIGACDHRIKMLKNMHQSEANFNCMKNMAKENASSSYTSQLSFMQNIPRSQLIPIPMKPLDDNNGMINFTNSTNQAYHHGINNLLGNIQQGSACSNFIPNMAHEEATSSYPSQRNNLQNIPQSQLIPIPMKPLDDNNGMTNFTNSTNQFDGAYHLGINNLLENRQQGAACSCFIPNMAQGGATSSHQSQLNMHSIPQIQLITTPMKPLSEMANFIDSTNQVYGASSHGVNLLKNLQQGGACSDFIPNMAHEEAMKLLNDNNGIRNFTNQVDVPLDSANQHGEYIDQGNQWAVFEQWLNESDDNMYWFNQLVGIR